ncbi:MAG TPA: YsnF/AvaK domain-containing protein [Anditalea sp.]|nr:YsnF/AvaK domain-containing protein [Anditalea sp.]
MSHTVVAIFENFEQAREAASKLYSNGFNDSNVDLSVQEPGNTTGNRGTDYDSRRDDNDSSIGSFFDNLFGSDNEDSRRYSDVGRRGTILTVHARNSEEAHRASNILDQYGAMDVHDSYERNRNRDGSNTESAHRSETESIPVIEEELQVGKREVQSGGVRIRSRIIEKPVEEKIRLRTEHISVNRKPADRAATQEELDNFQEGTIDVSETHEKPVVNKDSRVVEEVNLEKNVSEREETIRDTVRGTRVETEKYDDDDRHTDRRNDSDRDRRGDSDYNSGNR